MASSTESTIMPVIPGSMISGTEPRRNASTGVPHAMASIITSPKGSGQSTGNSSALAPPRNSLLPRSLISPMYSIPGPLSSGSICSRKYDFIYLVDLCRDLERHA